MESCPKCKNSYLVKAGKSKAGLQRFKCKSCLGHFSKSRSEKKVDVETIKKAYELYTEGRCKSIKQIAEECEGIAHSVIYKWMAQDSPTNLNDIENPFERIGKIKYAFPELKKRLKDYDKKLIVKYYSSHISICYRLIKSKKTKDIQYKIISFKNIRIQENGRALFQLKVHYSKRNNEDTLLSDYCIGEFKNRNISGSRGLTIKDMNETEFFESFIDNKMDPNEDNSYKPIEIICEIVLKSLQNWKRNRNSKKFQIEYIENSKM